MDKDKKQCEICGEAKPLSQFSKSYPNRCRKCVAEQTRRQRKGNGIHATTVIFDDPIPRTAPTPEDKASKRYELTKIALQGIMAHADIEGMNTRQLAVMAVDIADETLRALSIMDVEFDNI